MTTKQIKDFKEFLNETNPAPDTDPSQVVGRSYIQRTVKGVIHAVKVKELVKAGATYNTDTYVGLCLTTCPAGKTLAHKWSASVSYFTMLLETESYEEL